MSEVDVHTVDKNTLVDVADSSHENGLVWNDGNSRIRSNYWGCIWLCYCGWDCNKGCLVYICISNKCFDTEMETQNMSTGENIKRIRNKRGITQKELGIAIGFGEESASPRIAQYETGSRTPRDEILKKIAEVLQVDQRNIAIPTGYKEEDMIYRLLVLEDYFPEMKLERNTQTGDVVINFHNKKLNDFLLTWGVMRGKREQGLISEEEYLNWKYRM